MEQIQIFLVHGGMTFKSKKDYLDYLKTRDISISKKIKWYDTYLEENLGNNYKIIRPRMPLQDNARYEEWKIHFERHIPYLKDNIILIGSSLGGIFLAKYLSENKSIYYKTYRFFHKGIKIIKYKKVFIKISKLIIKSSLIGFMIKPFQN